MLQSLSPSTSQVLKGPRGLVVSVVDNLDVVSLSRTFYCAELSASRKSSIVSSTCSNVTFREGCLCFKFHLSKHFIKSFFGEPGIESRPQGFFLIRYDCKKVLRGWREGPAVELLMCARPCYNAVHCHNIINKHGTRLCAWKKMCDIFSTLNLPV